MKNKLTILGSGISGIGAAILAKQLDYDVFLSDLNPIVDSQKQKLDELGIVYEEGKHNQDKILESDLVVKSPGVPNESNIIEAIEDKKIPIVSEIEFGSQHTKAKIIAITGSNGKTTTSSLVYYILNKAKCKVALGGNIGKSFCALIADDNDYDFFVLEVSSFQLDNVVDFQPYIALLLNITPDHLDRYQNRFELYAKAKFKITQNQTNKHYFVYNADCTTTSNLLKEYGTKAIQVPFSIQSKQITGANANQKKIEFHTPNTLQMNIAKLALPGTHNLANSLAAGLAANILNIRKEIIKESLSDFEAVEHRMEKVLKIGGIQFVNDSKATNVNATYYALSSMQQPTVWIVGGVDKGNDYEALIPVVKDKVKAIVCLGIDNQKIINSFAKHVDWLVEANNMPEAVKKANQLGVKGDCVLLSPACASFDLFKNYEDRGEQFKKAVKAL